MEASEFADAAAAARAAVVPRRVLSFGKSSKKEKLAAPAAAAAVTLSEHDLLSKAFYGVQTERRQLLGRVATLQHRLREEVLVVADVDQHDDPKETRMALTELFAQIKRIVDSSEDPANQLVGEAAEVSLELEALRLRRELAAVKMEAARLAGQRDEMRHTVAELHKQLMGEAKMALRKTRRGSKRL